MKIAVIEDDPGLVLKLSDLLQGQPEWTVDFFSGSSDFGKATLEDYGIIVSDLSLAPLNGRELLKSLSEKTPAELLLMNEGTFEESDVQNDYITDLVDKNSLPSLVDKIKYIMIKQRIQRMATEEKESLEKVFTNGDYTIDKKDDVSVIQINNLNGQAEQKIKNFLSLVKNNVIIRIPSYQYLTSKELAMLAGFYRQINKKSFQLTLVLNKGQEKVHELLRLCKLDTLIPIVYESDSLQV